MNSARVWVGIVLLIMASATCRTNAADAPEVVPAAAGPTNLDGQGLALQLASMEPLQNSEVRGRLFIKGKQSRSEVPFICKVIRRESNWESVFEALATNNSSAETLVVIHTPGAPNRYLWGRAQGTNAVTPQPISPDKAATTGFAGSDYTLADLGLDFLHWPMQERLRGRTRLNRICYVLESRNDRASEIVWVRSFIDQEYVGTIGSQGFPAILVAEAYDIRNKMVKEFSLHGSSFKKVDGQYRLQKMEISNYETGSETTMKFD